MSPQNNENEPFDILMQACSEELIAITGQKEKSTIKKYKPYAARIRCPGCNQFTHETKNTCPYYGLGHDTNGKWTGLIMKRHGISPKMACIEEANRLLGLGYIVKDNKFFDPYGNLHVMRL
jgi:RNA polymerase subunit RPABC4/transcription elongation factor Spt4